jgi:hypothetical protein
MAAKNAVDAGRLSTECAGVRSAGSPENRGITPVACIGFVLYKARVEKIGWHSGSAGGNVPGEVSSKLSGNAANEGGGRG